MSARFLNEFSEIFEVSPDEMGSNFKFNADLHWDSLAIVSTIALIDEHFNITVKADDFVSCKTFEELTRMIEAKVIR